MKKISNLDLSQIKIIRYVIGIILIPFVIYALMGSSDILSQYIEAIAIFLLFILGILEYLNNYKFVAVIDFLLVALFAYNFYVSFL